MTWLDIGVLMVVAVSVVWGAWRGFIREAVGIGGWILAFVMSNILAQPVSDAFAGIVANAELRFAVAFAAVLLATLLVCLIAASLISRKVKDAGLAPLDFTLGGVFGIFRGVVIVLAVGFLAGLTTFPSHPVWHESASGDFMARAVLALRPLLPADLSRRLRYD